MPTQPPRKAHTKLPPDLFDTYREYKLGTTRIIHWLITSLTACGCLECVIDSVSSLRSAAETAHGIAIQVPLEVKDDFKKTISARRRLSRFFEKRSGQSDAARNSTHEFFTNSLKEVYTLLCGDESCKECAKTLEQKLEPQSCQPPRNRFELLSDYPQETKTNGNCTNTYDWHTQQQTETTSEHSGNESHLMLVDDELSRAMEVAEALMELQSLFDTVGKSWEGVAAHSNSAVLAAFVTNTTFRVVDIIEFKIRLATGSSDPSEIDYDYVRSKMENVSHEGDELAISSDNQIIDQLQEARAALESLRVASGEQLLGKRSLQKVTNFIQSRSTTSVEDDRSCLSALAENLSCIVDPSETGPSTVIRQGTPLHQDVVKWQTSQAPGGEFKCAVGLRMLLTSCQSFVWASETPSPANLRLQALRFAQEVLGSLQAVLDHRSMPCRCCRTLAFYLEVVNGQLQSFTKELSFDLFSQMPWVAGSQMLEILEATFYYGLRLCSYKHYVGAVLHVYNVLKRYGRSEPVPLLEHLSEVLKDVVFCGQPPSRNFYSCFVRFMGGRIKFHSKTLAPHQRHRQSWNLQLQRSRDGGTGMRLEANDERFTYDKVSLFHHIKGHKYAPCEPVWRQIRKQNDGQLPRRGAEIYPSSPHERVTTILQAVKPEFEGDFPKAKINFFAVYLACVKIVETMADKTHGDGSDLCLCFAASLLQAADFHQMQGRSKRFPEKKLLKACQAAVDGLKDRPLSEFLWNI